MILTRSKGFPHGGTHSLPVARRQARCFLKLAMFQKSSTGTRQNIHTAICAVILVAAAMVRAGLGAESPELLASKDSAAVPQVGKRQPIKPIPLDLKLDARKVTLGQALFHDVRLSRDGTISCASCHEVAKGGTDGRAHSTGIENATGAVNAPTVLNSGLNFKQFWDGRATTLEEQIDGPVHSVVELGSSWPEIVGKLRATDYAARFATIYRDGLQPQNIKDAIAQFERSLITPNSRFDKYLRGDDSALTAEEKAGYRVFKSHGCTSCHQGVNVGGNMFATLGAMADYFADRGNITKADYGRFNVTGQESDRFVFKVPSLRNVALTAPYFHDGTMARLEDAVIAMGQYQLGAALPAEDVAQIVQFLKTLTGELGGNPL